jgi:RNA polymerase sigma factor (sigma-70 family)
VSTGTDSRDAPLSALLREEVLGRVRQAIEDLPEDLAKVMRLRLQGVKSDEIALLLELKSATIRKRESRALARLRERLRPPDTESDLANT